jgi:hypothetical protein
LQKLLDFLATVAAGGWLRRLSLIDPRNRAKVCERHVAVCARDFEPHNRFFTGDGFRRDAKFDRDALFGKDLLRGNVSEVKGE